MKYLVGIDVETTTLDPDKGEIIEVAAVRYSLVENSKFEIRNSKQAPISRFVKLLKPARPIPSEITVLTGITNEMVADAPSFSAVAEELTAFIGDDLIFAHNASFDLKWLRYHGLSLAKNRVWDTFPIAAVAWPEAESYNLAALFESVGPEPRKIPLIAGSRGAHSALYDVGMAWQVLQAARGELQMSPGTYKHVIDLLERSGLGHYTSLFYETGGAVGRLKPRGIPRGPAEGGGSGTESRAERVPAVTGLPAEASAKAGPVEALGENGPLAKAWPHFVPRPEQQQMAQVIETTMREGGISLIEAPTGIGKTVAYVTPLLLHNKDKAPNTPHPWAIISTYTKHLQDQLISQDVPNLQAALGTDCRVAVLKGRRNYICTRRLGLALEKKAPLAPEAWLLIKILRWLEKGGSGDIDRLNISHQGEAMLVTLHADSPVCRHFCARLPDGQGRQAETSCPYQRAWQAAEKASVLIINHALLADPTLTGRWPLKTIIVDEAHHLEAALRRSTEVSLQPWYLEELLSPLLQSEASAEPASARHIRAEAKDLLADYQPILETLHQFILSHQTQSTLHLTRAVRRSSQWGVIEKHLEHWVGRSAFLCGLLESRAGLPADRHGSDTSHLITELKLFTEHVVRFVKGAASRIQWVDLDDRGGMYLHDVALSIAPFLDRLYEKVPALIVTSATLTTGGTFAYVKDTLGIPTAHEVALPSSFPLADNLLLYLVEDAPDPRRTDYDASIARHIETLSLLFGGRLLGLFTSFKSIDTVFNLLNHSLNKAHIRLYAQGHTGGRSNMLRRFREEPRSVLLGTDSFWEGIDIPGNTLSCVVIPKLPFAPPYDPVTTAVAEARGVDDFSMISLPRMILKMRQGIGRLIRRRDDRGVVVIFDSRLHTAGYGQTVIQSLPNGRIKIGSAADLPEVIEAWIGKDILESWNLESRI